ncbi:hypothetical protein Rsub_02324 [Raphidocelis subcapitata]|uniref:Uncharacterized protein n=1 Tax=Raphidocelis subcapitata TaxID=307507 RepID=A0A2V0NPR3_9CHLO|nr:hypothetical protein Rsub_02324 [Raphidocelis subcapitata]|eukprot:GBF89606.1 hypothetical protein Rsub_02324 [Raphidocelis subcapitata]
MQPQELLLIARYFGHANAMSTLRAVSAAVPHMVHAARAASASAKQQQPTESQLIDAFFRDGHRKRGGEEGSGSASDQQ